MRLIYIYISSSVSFIAINNKRERARKFVFVGKMQDFSREKKESKSAINTRAYSSLSLRVVNNHPTLLRIEEELEELNNHGPSPFKQRREDRHSAAAREKNRPEEERIQKPSETEEAKTELRPAVAHTESENRPEV